MGEERRQAARVHFESRLRIRLDGDEIEAIVDTRNISLKGLYVLSEKKPPVGTRCLMDIDITGPVSRLLCTFTGVICRHDADGMGIKFEEMNPDTFVHLQNFIRLKQNLIPG
ncbi:PilZ domain-containing protein [Desulfolithobacter sp.]